MDMYQMVRDFDSKLTNAEDLNTYYEGRIAILCEYMHRAYSSPDKASDLLKEALDECERWGFKVTPANLVKDIGNNQSNTETEELSLGIC